MLTALTIKNYALIDHLQVDFTNGFTIITGETGAGKSILLGGLSLILGKRADLSSLKDPKTKCIIEAVFDVSNYHLKALFQQEDLDYEAHTIIRREILPSGKSRAFVNDSPVNLGSLQVLGNHLIDIHSQHQTLQLTENTFQFQVVDALAKNQKELKSYTEQLAAYKTAQKELQALLDLKLEALKAHDYDTFLLNELVEANLVDGELEALEAEYDTLSNVGTIKEHLSEAYQYIGEEQVGAITTMTNLKLALQKLVNVGPAYSALYDRVNSCCIELDDIYAEVDVLQESVEADPNRLETVNSKLQLLNNVLQKHQVATVAELISIRETLTEKVAVTENLDDAIATKEKAIAGLAAVLDDLAARISAKRTKAIPSLLKQLQKTLADLGMPNAAFQIEVKPNESYQANGKDTLVFLFSANKGGQFNALKKAASGGELSRIMLAIKLILSKYIQLPTIMFDEIDTGVSGEISNKMGAIMLQMSANMQVFAITHLPQVAAKGHAHFKVYKETIGQTTQTNLVPLSPEARITEVAQMLGGAELSSSAVAHAKELLN
jgi:DNA repair protein RecN (Recombination protein N)